MAAIKQDGLTLVEASEELKDDKEVVSTATKKMPFVLQYASKRLQEKFGKL